MVDIENIRARFAARLNEALNDHPDLTRESHGRNIDLKKGLERAGLVTTTQATSKWLRGESMPKKDNMLILAKWLGVRAEWLEYGEGDKCPGTYRQADSVQIAETLEALYSLHGKVTPRSRKSLDAIERAANDGRLTEDDVLLLERIAQRFESTNQQD